ncbi:MAG: glycosyltransferase family 4 protein [Myxacorys chilensis ATA2-1-KO14]|jgi:glycosyltransferase involved in cell wall biosynthesis|nr:glycosyltransferase family 4 protein [Myxacorys chilensis ATA2-1-KO14]
MEVKNILVTGEPLFLERHQFLFTELSKYVDQLNLLPRDNEWYEARPIALLLKAYYAARIGSISKAHSLLQKNQKAFALKSKRVEQQISQLGYIPDLVLHIFGTYSPFWNRSNIPYVMYLDYTMALAERNWQPWACFINSKERNAWFEQEQQTYNRSKYLFTMSNVVKQSLIKDYNIDANKITVVGTASCFDKLYEGEKTFGTQQILFNGSDFNRKGGDILFEAFKLVKQTLPDAKLVVIGKEMETSIPGIEVLGSVSASELENILLDTDLVVAPARCEPFGIFLIDAMSYGVPYIVVEGEGNGITEFLSHEVDGIVLNELNSELLAHSIIRLLSDPCLLSSLSKAAQLKVKTKLNWNTVAKTIAETIAIYVSFNG